MAGLKVLKTYPMAPNDYLWVHPYIHRYSDHIRIKEGILFEAVGHGARKLRGAKVIEICCLDEVKTIEQYEMSMIATRSRPLHEVIFALIGTYPDSSSEILAAKVSRRPDCQQYEVQQIVELIDSLRETGYSGLRPLSDDLE